MLRIKKSGNERKNQLLILLSGILCLFVLIGSKVIDKGLDNLLLVEKRAPFYQNYLQNDLAVQRRVTRDVDKIKNYNNYFVSTSVKRDTYSIGCGNDGSITFSGYNNTDDYVFERFYAGSLLSPGTYRFKPGTDTDISSDDIFLYVEGHKAASDGTIQVTFLASANGQPFTISDSDDYEYCYIALRIAPGYKNDNLYMNPQLVPTDTSSDKSQPSADVQNYISDSRFYYNFRTVSCTKAQLSSSTSQDWKIFMNQLRTQVKKGSYDWYSVLFNDGTGIEFEECDPSKGRYGEVDPLGRVKKVKGYLYNAGDYMTLTSKDGVPIVNGNSERGINGVE